MSYPVEKRIRESGKCPIHFALEIFGDKWSLLIVRDLVFKGKTTYGEFSKSSEGIATNILSNRLSKLETNGILTKSKDLENQTIYRYQLTQKGLDLIPVLLAMTEWSAKYNYYPNDGHNIIHGAPEDLLKRLKSDRITLIDEISNAIGASLDHQSKIDIDP